MQNSVYIVSTPIGNLKDFSQRGIEVLSSVDNILCEDTRVASKLLQSISVTKKLIIYNDHNATSVIDGVVRGSISGETYALISDAGTPLISDPGYKLVNACIENGIKYTVIPGASAVIAALTLSGLPSDRFMFVGFADKKTFPELAKVDSTLIFFESPKRIVDTLKNMNLYFNGRVVAVVREITKLFEEVVRGSFTEVLSHFESISPRGEFVLLLSPPNNDDEDILSDFEPIVEFMIDKVSIKDLSTILSKCAKISKTRVYDYLLNYSRKG